MKYTGKGRLKILVVGEAPGQEEDQEGEQFIGRAGRRLKRELKQQGINFFRDCWKTNALRCRPKDNKTPDSKQIAFCRPALFAEIAELKPKAILLFGAVAGEAVLGHLWERGKKFSMSQWLPWVIPYQPYNCWISTHYHPSYLERAHSELIDVLFRKGLKTALEKKGRPWKQVPNYADDVEIIYEASKAAKALRDFKKTMFAFDYEANCLKPEYEGAEIVSCSFSNEHRTISFPWVGEAVEATGKLLASPSKKIGCNIKFEERWTRHFFGHRVRNWYWDAMLAAHILNNAAGITSLKFQAFVRLGLPAYDTQIEPYLQSPKGKHLNQIRKVPLKNLLLYGGTDSRLTREIAFLQFLEM
jgi:uracil-DNA glycosylase family 4